ncbi:hypothetical protein MMC13_003817 [Lambiella insularis]|nr:hypothetical protein [Lambiella insularis]
MVIALQLVRRQPDCIKDVQSLLETKSRDLQRKMNVSDYCYLVRAMSARFPRVFVVIDALDECSEIENFALVLEELVSRSPSATTLRLIASSRNDLNVERLLDPVISTNFSLHGALGGDIRTYLEAEVQTRSCFQKLTLKDSALTSHIVRTVTKRAGGLFLQAKLQLEYISTMTSIRAVKVALNDLPNGLHETYDQVLQQIIAKNPVQLALVKSIFQWLMESVDALPLDRLAHAVSIHEHDSTFDLENVATDPEDLIAMCGCLVVVDHKSSKSKAEALVSLAHFTVAEYLRSDRLASSPLRFFYIDPLTSNLKLALTCIKYLSFPEFSQQVQTLNFHQELRRQHQYHQHYREPLALRYRLLDYAVHNWAIHLAQSWVSLEVFQLQVSPFLQWFLVPDAHQARYLNWQTALLHTCQEHGATGFKEDSNPRN